MKPYDIVADDDQNNDSEGGQKKQEPQHHQREASSSSASALKADGGNDRRSRSSIKQVLEQAIHSHFMSTAALCSSVLTMFFLLMSVFPYSGYMVLFLLRDDNATNRTPVTRETVGLDAGILTSSFMIGRAISGFPWGKLADVYGRKFVLVVALVASAVGSVAFGCATSYRSAILIRFVMGLGNGTMVVARTAISELAKGDRDLEQFGVAALMSMVGYGMLISPTVGGMLSEPLQQYPNSAFFHRYTSILERFPFLLPNLVAASMSALSLLAVVLCVEETLPASKRRSWLCAPGDLYKWIHQACCASRRRKPPVLPSPTTPTSIYIPSPSRSSKQQERQVSALGEDGFLDETSTELFSVSHTQTLVEEWEEAEKILDSREFLVASPLVCTPKARASLLNALHRSSMVSHLTKDEQDPAKLEECHSKQHRHSFVATGGETSRDRIGKRYSQQSSTSSKHEGTPLLPERDEDNEHTLPPSKSPTIQTLMANRATRLFMVSSWVYSFANVAQSEAFPLFAMSQLGRGLGMAEKDIGLVGTLSGLIYLIGQYVTFSAVMRYMGLVQAMRYGALFANLPIIFVPISLYLPRSSGGGGDWSRIVYLSVLMGVAMVSGSVYLGCNTIGANRTVDASQRATMNGLSSVGTSIGRGMGPICAGFLVTYSMKPTSWIPPAVGGWVVYSILLMIGLVAYWTTLRIPEGEDSEREEGGHEGKTGKDTKAENDGL